MKSNEELAEMKAEEAERLKELNEKVKKVTDKEKARRALIRDIERIREDTQECETKLGSKRGGSGKAMEGAKKGFGKVIDWLYWMKGER